MYDVTPEYRNGIARGNPQTIGLFFRESGVFLGGEDICIDDGGLQFTETFNGDDDLRIGGTPSSQISFTLFNDTRAFTDFEFGECKVMHLVKTGESEYAYDSGCNISIDVKDGNSTVNVLCSPETPYLKIGGAEAEDQPLFAVKGLIRCDDSLYLYGEDHAMDCIGLDGNRVSGFTTMDEAMYRNADIMVSHRMAVDIVPYTANGDYRNAVLIYGSGRVKEYAGCPLGVFETDRPNCVQKDMIDIQANDRMEMFEDDFPDSITVASGTTLTKLLTDICTYLGVPLGTVNGVNTNATLSGKPKEFGNNSIRTVVGWIAEAMGGIACFDRDGKLCIKWYSDIHSTAVYDESDYEEFEPYYYTVPQITKLVVRNSSNDRTHGSGDNAYLILNNPLLQGG